MAQRKGVPPREDTLRYARYVMLFTPFPAQPFSATEMRAWYRLRGPVELVFKRFKSLAQLGHLPKFDDQRARAWLYGKRLVARLTEKRVRHARTRSPWGYEVRTLPQSMEGIQVRPDPGGAGDGAVLCSGREGPAMAPYFQMADRAAESQNLPD